MPKASRTCRDHPCGPWHEELVGGYRQARAEQEARAEAWSGGHRTELDTFYRRRDTPIMDGTENPVLFKDWLIAHRGSTRRTP